MVRFDRRNDRSGLRIAFWNLVEDSRGASPEVSPHFTGLNRGAAHMHNQPYELWGRKWAILSALRNVVLSM